MNFQYKIRTSDGRMMTGVKEASDRAHALKDLEEQGIHPIAVIQIPGTNSAKPKNSFGKDTVLFQIGKPVKDQELLVFTRNLLSVVHSGIPLLSGLEDVRLQVKSPIFRGVLEKIIADIGAGSRMSDSFQKHPNVFSELYCNTIRAGEESGRLEEITDRLVATMERDIETKMTVQGALRYPLIVLGTLVIAFIVIVVFVIPKISKVFAQFGKELPLPTRVLIAVGDFAQAHGFGIIIVIAGIIAGFYAANKTPKGAYILDQIRYRFPVFGELSKKIETVKFTSTLQNLYASGVMLPDALGICSRVLSSPVLRKITLDSELALRQGKRFSEVIASNPFFPPLVLRMINTGEKTGSLESMLGEITKYYDRDIQYMLRSLTTLIEPILTVMMGCMVLALALGVFMPMWNVMKLFHS